MSRGVSSVSGPASRKSVHSPMSFFVFFLQVLDGNDFLMKIGQEVIRGALGRGRYADADCLEERSGNVSEDFTLYSASIECTSQSRSPPCTCK